MRKIEWKEAIFATGRFVKRQFLPLAFLTVVLIAMLAPAPGIAVGSVMAGPFKLISMINVIIVFFISGLSLNTKDIGKAFKEWPSILWGMVTILAITPCLGFAFPAIPYTPPEFGAGLAILSAAPTTLGVGAALVRQSKGNDALALFLLTASNMLAVFTTPLWLKALVSGEGTDSGTSEFNLDFSIGKVLWQLVVTVVVPGIIGKCLREFVPPVQRFATKYREDLSMFSVANLAMIVWMTLSEAQSTLIEQQFVNILYVIISAIVQHCIYLVFNWAVVRFVLRPPAEEAVAVVIMGSQKSAPVAVTIITYITSDGTVQGLLSVPCVIGQLVQIFMGAAFAPWVAKRVMKIKAARKVAENEKEEAEVVGSNEAGVAGFEKTGLESGANGARGAEINGINGVEGKEKEPSGISEKGSNGADIPAVQIAEKQ